MSCSVADSNCESPANDPSPKPLRTSCKACGERVCKSCSIISHAYVLSVTGRWCGSCLDSRTTDVFDPVLTTYWVRQVSIAGYAPSDSIAVDYLASWQRARELELSGPPGKFLTRG